MSRRILVLIGLTVAGSPSLATPIFSIEMARTLHTSAVTAYMAQPALMLEWLALGF
jgi:hypothetical protein